MNWGIFSTKAFKDTLESNDGWGLFVRYLFYFFLILVSLASISLYHIIATESNPFFYAKF